MITYQITFRTDIFAKTPDYIRKLVIDVKFEGRTEMQEVWSYTFSEDPKGFQEFLNTDPSVVEWELAN